jgi:act minimal PKS acyl carrier protein
MTEVTIEDLLRALRRSAGEDESDGPTGDVLDTPFMELGYDSLALLETVAQIKRDHGVAISDDDLAQIQTPRDFLAKVNSELLSA